MAKIFISDNLSYVSSNDNVIFTIDNSLQTLSLNTSSHLIWSSDGSGDIGSPDGGATLNRPASIYVKNKVVGSGTSILTGFSLFEDAANKTLYSIGTADGNSYLRLSTSGKVQYSSNDGSVVSGEAAANKVTTTTSGSIVLWILPASELVPNAAYIVEAEVVSIRSDVIGSMAGYKLIGYYITDASSAPTLKRQVVVDSYEDEVSLSADFSSSSIAVSVIGAAGQTWQWTGKVQWTYRQI